MTTFAILFMTLSMGSVTALTAFCMYKLLDNASLPDDDSTAPEDTG